MLSIGTAKSWCFLGHQNLLPPPPGNMLNIVMCIILDHLSYNTVRESRTVSGRNAVCLCYKLAVGLFLGC